MFKLSSKLILPQIYVNEYLALLAMFGGSPYRNNLQMILQAALDDVIFPMKALGQPLKWLTSKHPFGGAICSTK